MASTVCVAAADDFDVAAVALAEVIAAISPPLVSFFSAALGATAAANIASDFGHLGITVLFGN